MRFGRLLSQLRNNILHDKSDQPVGSVYSDYLWDDETLTDYINEAQRRFAVGSCCIRDGNTPEVCLVPMAAYQREYVLHPSVIAVISARIVGAKADLARAGHSAFDTYRMPDAYFFDTTSLESYPPGFPQAYGTDEYLAANDFGSVQNVVLRLYPVPSPPFVGTVKLRVVRKPMQEFTLTNLNAIPEIPDDHHMDMLDYAAYLALRIVDRDAGDPERAQEFLEQFEVNVKRARDIAMRKMFTPAQWGFGRNGFSYARDGDGS